MSNIIDYIINNKSNMTKKQQLLSDYILNNNQEVALMTVSQLADEAGVGKTTVLRFVQELGYNSFFDLKKELYEMQMDYSGKWENIQQSFEERIENNGSQNLYEVWQEDIKVLNESLTPQLVESFEKAVDIISGSSNLNLLGVRSYRGIAIYADVLLSEFYSNINQLSNDIDIVLDKILHFTKEDVLLIFELSPHSTVVVDAAELAYQQGVKIILITDNLSSPIAEFSEVIVNIKSSRKYFTIVAIIAFLEALAVELGQRESPKSIEKIKKLSSILRDKGYATE